MTRHRSLALSASVVLLLALAGCGSDSEGQASEGGSDEPGTFTADLTLVSNIPVTLNYGNGQECSGMGNGALKGGKRYTVAADEKTIQHGELPDGSVVEVDGIQKCFFRFETELPAGHGYYTVDLGESQGYFEASQEELTEGVTMDRIDFEGRNKR